MAEKEKKLVTNTELARRLGYSKAYITKLKNNGILREKREEV